MAEASDKICPRCGTRYDASAAFCSKDGGLLQPTQKPTDPRVGQLLLGQFRIDEHIGSGGMGDVYRARQLAADRDVAIKLVHPELARTPDAFRRFQREARISGALDHPNVVRAFLSGQLDDGSLYLVMELLEGRTLADLLRLEPALPLARAIYILTQVADGVGAAHERGIVHRDIKPENVFLIQRGRDPDIAKVLDFGIARSVTNEDALTVAGLVLGTALYISPEGAAGQPTDMRSDVYSLGVVAYRVLAGITPFESSTAAQLLLKHLHQPPPPLVTRAGERLPAPIDAVVTRALSKTPSERYEDANDFAQALRDAALESGVEWGRPRTGRIRFSSPAVTSATRALKPASAPAPQLDLPPERLSWITLGVAFVVGALLVLGFALVWPHGSTAPSPAQIRAESLKRAESALAAHRWDGPDGVRATTDQLLAMRADDPDALRIRRDAATELVAEGDHERAAGNVEVARADYDLALGLLVDGSAVAGRLRALDEAEAAPHAEQIRITPEPSAGDTVLLTATLAESDTATADPRFVIQRDGHRVGAPVLAAPGAEPRTYSATHTFHEAGTYAVEFRIGHDAEGVAFRTNVVVPGA